MNIEEIYTTYIEKTNDNKDDIETVKTLNKFSSYIVEEPKEDKDGMLIVASLPSSSFKEVLAYMNEFLAICETVYDTLCKVDVYRYKTHYTVCTEKPSDDSKANIKYISKTDFRRNASILASEVGELKLGERLIANNILCIGKQFMNNNLYIMEGEYK